MDNKKTEVLAPVGNYESLTAAVRSGADAVYFGCKDFSARRNAVNFSFEEMEQAVKYCKRNSVKTYLTVNIAIKDSEINSALQTVKKAYLSGVDGLIVSDIGLGCLIHKMYPDIELHASTQMSVNSPSALKILKESGFCRIVPAREMSKSELSEFCKEAENLGMEVEVFVHGALCMCLSGQCLFSSVLGGRSGNRGLCAGPCRLPFTVEGGTGYDLSLKDLSLLNYIGELTDMGVSSFKIEGRMKRPEYTAAAVSACRKAVDCGKVPDDLNRVLEDVFSRSGFTDGYYKGKPGKDMFGVRSKDDVIKSKETYAFLHGLYRNELQKIPVKVNAEISENKPVGITIGSNEYEVSVSGNIPQKAVNNPVSRDNAVAQLSKLGGTPFFAENVSLKLGEGIFVSNKELNELRRSAVEKLLVCYEKLPERRMFENDMVISDKKHSSKPEIYAEFLDISVIPKELNFVDLIIIPLEKVSEKPESNIKFAVKIPKFTGNESKIEKLLALSKSKGIDTAVCDTLSAVGIALKTGFKIIGGIGLNVLNEYSAKVFNDLGIGKITLSAEMLLSRACTFKTVADKGIFAYGRLPLMTFKNCPVKNGRKCSECDKKGYITDRTNTKFPVRCHGDFGEMYNSKPVYLADKLERQNNLDYLILSFTTESKNEVTEIINRYINGADKISDFTRGLYFKDVL